MTAREKRHAQPKEMTKTKNRHTTHADQVMIKKMVARHEFKKNEKMLHFDLSETIDKTK